MTEQMTSLGESGILCIRPDDGNVEVWSERHIMASPRTQASNSLGSSRYLHYEKSAQGPLPAPKSHDPTRPYEVGMELRGKDSDALVLRQGG